MKILLITNKAPYPLNDGASIAIFNMAKGLVDNNAEVHLLSINTKKHYSPDDRIPKDFAKSTHYQSVYHDTDVSITGAISNLLTQESYFVSRFHFKDFENALREKLIKIDFDIVQIEGVFMASYLSLIRKNSKAKVVLRAHNIEYIIWERYLKASKNLAKNIFINIHQKRLKKFEMTAFKQVDAVIPITDVDADFLRNSMPTKPIFSSISGVDLAKYKPIEKAQLPDTIFYFGSMDWFPNIQAVEWFKNHCWEEIKRQTTADVKWIIAGSNIPKHIVDYSLDERIETISDVEDATLFYKKYNIQLVPLLSGSGLRIKLIEGLSYGKPIITTAIGMEGLYCKYNQELLIANTAKEFVDETIKMLRNGDNLQDKLSKNARAYATKNFENTDIVKKLIAFYNSL